MIPAICIIVGNGHCWLVMLWWYRLYDMTMHSVNRTVAVGAILCRLVTDSGDQRSRLPIIALTTPLFILLICPGGADAAAIRVAIYLDDGRTVCRNADAYRVTAACCCLLLFMRPAVFHTCSFLYDILLAIAWYTVQILMPHCSVVSAANDVPTVFITDRTLTIARYSDDNSFRQYLICYSDAMVKRCTYLLCYSETWWHMIAMPVMPTVLVSSIHLIRYCCSVYCAYDTFTVVLVIYRKWRYHTDGAGMTLWRDIRGPVRLPDPVIRKPSYVFRIRYQLFDTVDDMYLLGIRR